MSTIKAQSSDSAVAELDFPRAASPAASHSALTARTPAVDSGQTLTIIQASPGWRVVDVAELRRYRELLLFLVWRDIKVRYKQTVLGAAWAILQPLATMIVFSLFFSRVTHTAATTQPYPLFVLAGLLPWFFFSNAVSSASQSIISNQTLVTKIYFPRIMIPMGAVAAGLVDFAISLLLLVTMLAVYGVAPGWGALLAPVIVALLVLAALGVGTLLSALTVAYRDVRHIIPFLVQLWMFATPAIYLSTAEPVGGQWSWLLPLNPAHGLIANFRAAVLGGPFDWYALGVSTAVSLAFVVAGGLYFRRVERSFADIIQAYSVTSHAIQIANLSKRYRLGSGSGAFDRMLRDSISEAFTAPWRRIASRNRSPASKPGDGRRDSFWALKDVSLEVRPGEVVGVIGRNGSGKSTFLKILSRVTEPTSGRVELRGRVGSLLEVGTGFHPELTGRENIYLNGAILGMRKAEIDRKFDAIVAFAEIGEFLDTPVKRYSSGMYVRLAFAVASHLEPEILIVDEVLAVGDAQFQQKCLGRMSEVRREGRTVLFVSHNMGAVARLCDRAAWLEQGRMRALGGAEDIIADYLATSANNSGEVNFSSESDPLAGSDGVRLAAIRIRNHRGEIASSLDVRHPFTIEMHYRVFRPMANLSVGLRILTHDGVSVFTTRETDEGPGEAVRQPGSYVSRCTIPGNFLNYGQYFVSFGADCAMHQGHFSLHQVLSFQIEETGGIGAQSNPRRLGILRMGFPWTIEQIG